MGGALWIKFQGVKSALRTSAYPFAVKVAAGKRDALTGAAWWPKLRGNHMGLGQDYCVVPTQPWLDGFVVDQGKIRQFIAQPLGKGLTVEAQLDGKEEFGGLQIQVYPMKGAEFDRRFPVRSVGYSGRRSYKAGLETESTLDLMEIDLCCESATLCTKSASSPTRSLCGYSAEVVDMGLGAGGTMHQEVFTDPFKLEDWDQDATSRTFIHLVNSQGWQQITGDNPPTQPPNRNLYSRYRYPWYDFYQEGPTQGASSIQSGIKSVSQLAAEKGVVFPAGLGPITVVKGQVNTGGW